MRILVCGGRDYSNVSLVWATLSSSRATVIIHGGASGADRLAADWALVHGVPTVVYRADWGAHGRAAGPRRNAQMLAEGKPDLVMAFPGGPGTSDMVRRATRAGVPVMNVVDREAA